MWTGAAQGASACSGEKTILPPAIAPSCSFPFFACNFIRKIELGFPARKGMSQSVGDRGLKLVQLGSTPAAAVAGAAFPLSWMLSRPSPPARLETMPASSVAATRTPQDRGFCSMPSDFVVAGHCDRSSARQCLPETSIVLLARPASPAPVSQCVQATMPRQPSLLNRRTSLGPTMFSLMRGLPAVG